ncbi:hydroxyacylglutathione hydrolase [Ensifer sp. ENS07]|jgi:hydroxyacylglutathione hydrolase|uniref:hydroxyacylglutathione hydrolase n=1 Tax=Ensifer TaxID=106591 RepID=UPI0008871EEE|nr:MULTISPECIES: hydroxyacylglutathione hydrolase [Ensifer]MBD9596561.1 hydroxyacylglutathione hydrolase [Ensifer sp. ENS05]MBD9638385.1 hydroxyacylglutathione hydrolase [Ensifer sp. ENS07]UTV35766.1 hydroxyacylglutathione hydrolase [Ensifer adhaerens]SDN31789.1 hydroxyacylglutathione hydrolase [Ensifer sp. YR511]
MAALELDLFLCRTDNFGVLIHDPESGLTASIDAPEEPPILEALERRGWTLTHILTTHHHGDHVAANDALKARFGAIIIGPFNEAAKIPGLDKTVRHGERFEFAGRNVEVIETPGHTAGHICFHFPQDKLLFAADTLFALGCGRLFEGTPATMWQSLSRLMALPDDTTVYFGHEYTLSNARFAVTVDPDNAELKARAAEIEEIRCDGGFTAPTTIGLEKRTNPFLRAADPGIRAHLGLRDADDAAVFAEIRKRKDNF